MKSRLSLFGVVLIFLAMRLVATAQQNTFTSVFYQPYSYNSVLGYALVEDMNLNYLVAGEHNWKAFLLNMDQTGQLLWMIDYDFGGYEAMFTRVIPTNDFCYMVAGTIDVHSSYGDIFCAKVTADGDTIWSKSYDSGMDEILSSVRQTSDHGFIISGYAGMFSADTMQMFLLKTDSTGTMEWMTFMKSGSENNIIRAVTELPGIGYAVTGICSDAYGTEANAFIAGISDTGNLLWAKRADIPGAYFSEGYDLQVRDSTIWSLISAEGIGFVVIQTDFSGSMISCRRFTESSGLTMYLAEQPQLHKTSDNGFVFVTPGQDGSLVKLDSTGTGEWSKYVYLMNVDVIQSADGGFLVIGNGPLLGCEMAPTLNPQTGIIKTDSLGESDGCIYQSEITTYPCDIDLTDIQVEYLPIVVVVVEALHPEISIVTVLTHNGCVAASGSIDDPPDDLPHLIISPNPSDGNIQISQESGIDEKISVEVFNSLGKKVWESTSLFTLPVHLDVSFLPDGIYLIQSSAKTSKTTAKILIHH